MRSNRFLALVAASAALGASLALAQETVQLRNGVTGDGELEVNPDTYGAVTVWTWAQNNDFYDGAGAVARHSPSFAASVFLYNRATQDRVALGALGHDLNTTYNLRLQQPSTLDYAIIDALVASDSDSDGTNDTAKSKFAVMGSGYDLTFGLTQSVSKPAPSTSISTYTKKYTITNDGPDPVSFMFNQHNDMDLMHDALAEDCAGAISVGSVRNVYMREAEEVRPDFDATSIALSGSPGYSYTAAKSGFDPDGSDPDPPYAYGTDFQIWGAYGLPDSWKNNVAGVGNNMDGILGALKRPNGSLLPWDAFMALEWPIDLAPGASTDITVVTTYGSKTPAGGGCDPCDMNCDGAVNSFDIENFIDVLFNNETPCSACAGDVDGNGQRNAFDIDPFILCLFGP